MKIPISITPVYERQEGEDPQRKGEDYQRKGQSPHQEQEEEDHPHQHQKGEDPRHASTSRLAQREDVLPYTCPPQVNQSKKPWAPRGDFPKIVEVDLGRREIVNGEVTTRDSHILDFFTAIRSNKAAL